MKTRLISVKLFPVLLLVLILSSCGGSSTSNQYAIDPVEKSFVAMGDLQIAGAQSVLVNPSTTNIPQLRQNVADIAALPHKPDYSFILGDLVKGEVHDQGQTLQAQLDAWMTVFRGLPGSAGINVIPLPGNHEMDYKDETVKDEAPLIHLPISFGVTGLELIICFPLRRTVPSRRAPIRINLSRMKAGIRFPLTGAPCISWSSIPTRCLR